MKATEFITESAKKGLYYYVNKRKKAGTSRSKNNPKAPSEQDWKDAAKTAKKESVEESQERCPQCGSTNCKCPAGKCNCKPVAGWVPGKGFQAAMDEAANAAQKQAAIAISMKQAGKKPKHSENIDPEYDDEAGMADNNLETLERAVQGIDDLISAGDNLPEWCQEKIAVSKSMLVAVWDYMASEKERKINDMYEALDDLAESIARHKGVDVDDVWAYFESLEDHELYLAGQESLTEDWQKVNKHDKTDGMSRKAVKAYRRENPGSKLKTAVTTKPSKLKKGGKASKRRKSFCARMSGMKKSRASAKTKRDPDSPINKALRRWNC